MSMSTADYRELATEAQNHRDDEAAEIDALVSMRGAEARAKAEAHFAPRLAQAQEYADRLDAVATLRELADAVENGVVRSVAFVALGDTEVATAYASIDRDYAGLLGGVTSLSNRIDREQLAA